MTIKNLYIARHGQTDYNRQGIVQGGGIDSNLNDVGKCQAQSLYETLKHISFDSVYTSSLKRTIQTVQGFSQTGQKVTNLAEFNEMNWGVHEGVAVTPESHQVFRGVIESWESGDYKKRMEGGETPLEVQKRLIRGMSIVLKKQSDTNILICTHGRSMRILLASILNYELAKMDHFDHSNAGYYHVIWYNGVYSIRRFNENSHTLDC